MKTTIALSVLSLVICHAPATQAAIFDWATVGNPGNIADDTGFGAVDYLFRISKHEVTNAQYTEFLNAVDSTGSNPDLGGGDPFLYNPLMSTRAIGGINFNVGAAIGSKYEIKPGRANNPVVLVSFFDAMRFVNWLQNGQGSGDTETGVYTIGSGKDEVRNPGANYFIPSDDEWYKAAYHKNNGITGNYWDYPTSTDTEPYSDNPVSLNTPDDTSVANFFKDDGSANGYDDGYAVTGSTSFDRSANYFTNVGVFSQVASSYGTFDQGGNVWEWTEENITLFRGLRGDAFDDNADDMLSSHRTFVGPQFEHLKKTGIRVASKIPEPTTSALTLVATLFFVGRRRPTF